MEHVIEITRRVTLGVKIVTQIVVDLKRKYLQYER